MEFKKVDLDLDYEKYGFPDNGKRICLECYIPDKRLNTEMGCPDRRNNAILVLPGGGYHFTSSRECEPIAFQFLAAGFTVFTLNYSIVPAVFPQSLYEVYTAIAMIRRNADEWCVNKDRIAVCGFSAGGHLAASAGAFWNEGFIKEQLGFTDEHKPNAMVLGYPVITGGEYAHKGSFKNLLGKKELTDEDIKFFSIENRITEDFPRSFVWHTSEDAAVPVENSLMLCEQLAHKKIMFELHVYPKGGHGLALSNHITTKPSLTSQPPVKPRAWVKDCIAFLDDIAYI